MKVPFPGFVRNMLVLLRLTTAITAALLLIALPFRERSDDGPPVARYGVRYRAQEVRFPGFENGYLLRVNSRGEAVGVAWNGNSCGADKRPFLWKDGKLTELTVPKKLTSATAIDINDQGVIVGYGLDNQGRACGVLWKNGDVQVITVGKPENDTMLIAVNGKGDMTGAFREAKDPTVSHAFLISENKGRLLGDFHPTCMNSQGVVAGVSFADPWLPRAVVYHQQRLITLPLPDGAIGSIAYDVNSQGAVVGLFAREDYTQYPALWKGGTLQRVSQNSGVAFGINDRGQVTGYGTSSNTTGAMLWENGTETLLKDVVERGDSLRPIVAFDINDAGTIVGWSSGEGNEARGFILTPIGK